MSYSIVSKVNEEHRKHTRRHINQHEIVRILVDRCAASDLTELQIANTVALQREPERENRWQMQS